MAARAPSVLDAVLLLGFEGVAIVGNGGLLMVLDAESLGVDVSICEFEAETRLEADGLVGGGIGGTFSLSVEEALILGIFDLEWSAKEEDRFRRPSSFGLVSTIVIFGGFFEPAPGPDSVRIAVPLSRLMPEG